MSAGGRQQLSEDMQVLSRRRTSVSPVVALDLGDGGDVAGAKGSGLAGKHDEQQAEDQQGAAPAYSEACHGVVVLGVGAVVMVVARVGGWMVSAVNHLMTSEREKKDK